MAIDAQEAFWEGFLGEFFKLSSLSPEELHKAIERVEEIENTPVDHDKLLRYGALGAVTAPLASALDRIVAGDDILARSNGKIRWGKSGRQQVGKMVGGAIAGGLLPLARHHLDRVAERARLKSVIQAYENELSKKSPVDELVPDVPAVKVSTALIPNATRSPRSRLRSAMRIGAEDGSANITDPFGPSISQISKPRGFGVPLPGTTKPSSGV